LREHGVAITRRFYADMFAAHPELKNTFNMGNQANGSQQGALASAVLAYAANIDNPQALAPVMERIAHKHASLGITPGQYTIVGRYLLGAIQQVLGEAATPALLAAWDEAYWLLACELIALEARLYERASVTPGALRELIVTDVQRESDDTLSFYLQTREGGSPGPFSPGQYVSVAVELPEQRRQLRQYSLSDGPSRPYWRITVKAEPATTQTPEGCVSNLLHANVRRGQVLRVSAPFGDLRPLETIAAQPTQPIVLLSAGVGVTPFTSVLNALADTGSERPVLFAHAARDRAHHVLRRDVEQARDRLPQLRVLTCYESTSSDDLLDPSCSAGWMTFTSDLVAPYRDGAFFLCGPLPFMRAQWKSLLDLGIFPTQMHREVFGPELLDHLL